MRAERKDIKPGQMFMRGSSYVLRVNNKSSMNSISSTGSNIIVDYTFDDEHELIDANKLGHTILPRFFIRELFNDDWGK
jgi:hypothetical protein